MHQQPNARLQFGYCIRPMLLLHLCLLVRCPYIVSVTHSMISNMWLSFTFLNVTDKPLSSSWDSHFFVCRKHEKEGTIPWSGDQGLCIPTAVPNLGYFLHQIVKNQYMLSGTHDFIFLVCKSSIEKVILHLLELVGDWANREGLILTWRRRIVWPFWARLSIAHFSEVWLFLSLSIATAINAVPDPSFFSCLLLGSHIFLSLTHTLFPLPQNQRNKNKEKS